MYNEVNFKSKLYKCVIFNAEYHSMFSILYISVTKYCLLKQDKLSSPVLLNSLNRDKAVLRDYGRARHEIQLDVKQI